MKPEHKGILGRTVIHYMEGFDNPTTEVGVVEGMTLPEKGDDIVLTLSVLINDKKDLSYVRALASMCLLGEPL